MNNQMYIFGGIVNDTVVGLTTVNDLWSYDPNSGKWVNMPAEVAPSPRYGATISYINRVR
jgi:N-acetylneuraminic acid mutarotase